MRVTLVTLGIGLCWIGSLFLPAMRLDGGEVLTGWPARASGMARVDRLVRARRGMARVDRWNLGLVRESAVRRRRRPDAVAMESGCGCGRRDRAGSGIDEFRHARPGCPRGLSEPVAVIRGGLLSVVGLAALADRLRVGCRLSTGKACVKLLTPRWFARTVTNACQPALLTGVCRRACCDAAVAGDVREML